MTEVGIIPEDWQVKQICDVAEICGGGTPSTTEKSFWGGDINWFTPAEINDSVVFVTESERKITKEGLKQSSAKLLPVGSILLTTRATIGTRAISKGIVSTNQGFQSLIPKEGTYNLFLYYTIPSLKNEMIARASGSTFLEISSSKLSTIKLAVPSYEEQVLIGDSLFSMDSLISSLESKISKKKQIKEGTMQQLLTGKKRLPGFHNDWVEKSIGDIAVVKSGYPFKSESYSSLGDFTIITISNVKNGYLCLDDYNKIISCPNDLQKHQKLKIGDIVVSMTGNVGRVCIIDRPNCLLNQRVGLLQPSRLDIIDKDFLFTILNNKKFEEYLIHKGQGAAQANVGNKDIESYIINIPSSIKEQIAIASSITDMDSEIKALESEREKYLLIKQGMMQDLLTGKTRLI